MKICKKILIPGASGVALAAASSSASAEAWAMDVSTVTAMITGGAATGVSEIGLAMLGLAAVAIAFKWAKGAIFG